MTRYQALRRLKLSIVTSWLIAFLNWIWDVPPGKIYFMSVVIEYETEKTMRRAKKYLAWLEEYGLTRTHRAQRIILRQVFEVGSRFDSIKYAFGVDTICAEVEAQTGYPINDKMFFARHTLDGLMWKTGCKANLGNDGLMEVELSK